jgi:hypothetical protein
MSAAFSTFNISISSMISSWFTGALLLMAGSDHLVTTSLRLRGIGVSMNLATRKLRATCMTQPRSLLDRSRVVTFDTTRSPCV